MFFTNFRCVFHLAGVLGFWELGIKYLLAHLLGHESDPIPGVYVRSQKVMFERLGFKQKSKDC